MKSKLFINLLTTLAATALTTLTAVHAQATTESGQPLTRTNAMTIPSDQIGAVAEKQYSGDGLSVVATKDGALLRCVFQRMSARATTEGLCVRPS